jgi:SAM-dependent methyltransferase
LPIAGAPGSITAVPDRPPPDDRGELVVVRAQAYFDAFAHDYDEAADGAGWVLNDLLAEGLSTVGPVRTALDVACGTGATLEVVRRAFPGAALTGLDVSAPMLERAQRRVPVATFVHADAARYAADAAAALRPDARFDLVTAIGGLEFTADLPAVLADLGRLVRPHGHLVVTYEPVIAGWEPQEARMETNLGSNGLELTTVRWEADELMPGFVDWMQVRSLVVAAYQRDGVPVVYHWIHVRREA